MAHCKHRVMDKCKKSGSPCTFSADCFEAEEGPRKTEGDRIRTMADGDLARFLLDIVITDAIPFCRCLAECEEDMEADRPIPESRCLECMENWLGKEAQA